MKLKIKYIRGFPGGSVVKNLPASAEDGFSPWAKKLPWRRKWQPAWKIPWTEEPGGLQSMWLRRVRYDLLTKTRAAA